MSTLLHIDSSPLEGSITRELTREYVNAWKQTNPDGAVIRRDLYRETPKSLDQEWINASYTPADARTPEQHRALEFSDRLIAELEQADEVVIGVAMHNFMIPSVLKLWIDHVVRAGRTFKYGSNGPQPLLTGKKATIIEASGGVYEPGTPAAAMNFIEPYLRTILGFIGITDVRFVRAAGVARLHSGAVQRETFLRPALDQLRAALA